MLANSTGAAEQTPDSEHDEQLLLPHKLDENMKALEEYHLLQHDEFVKTVNKNADECEKLYAEIMGVVHRYVPQSLSGVGLQSTRDSNVMASRMVTRFAKIMNNAAKATHEQQTKDQFDAMSTPFVRKLSAGWQHEKRKRILKMQEMHQEHLSADISPR